MTASGIPYPRGRFFFSPWNHWRWVDLSLWRDLSLAPRHQVACAYCIVGRSPVKQPGFFLPASIEGGTRARVQMGVGCGARTLPSGYSRKTDP